MSQQKERKEPEGEKKKRKKRKNKKEKKESDIEPISTMKVEYPGEKEMTIYLSNFREDILDLNISKNLYFLKQMGRAPSIWLKRDKKIMQEQSLHKIQQNTGASMDSEDQKQFLNRDAPQLWLASAMKERHMNPEAVKHTLSEIDERSCYMTDKARWNLHIQYFNGMIRMLLFISSFAHKHPKEGYIFLGPLSGKGWIPSVFNLKELHVIRMYAESKG